MHLVAPDLRINRWDVDAAGVHVLGEVRRLLDCLDVLVGGARGEPFLRADMSGTTVLLAVSSHWAEALGRGTRV